MTSTKKKSVAERRQIRKRKYQYTVFTCLSRSITSASNETSWGFVRLTVSIFIKVNGISFVNKWQHININAWYILLVLMRDSHCIGIPVCTTCVFTFYGESIFWQFYRDKTKMPKWNGKQVQTTHKRFLLNI